MTMAIPDATLRRAAFLDDGILQYRTKNNIALRMKNRANVSDMKIDEPFTTNAG